MARAPGKPVSAIARLETGSTLCTTIELELTLPDGQIVPARVTIEFPSRATTPYDPAIETDPLIQEYITWDSQREDAVFRAHPYPVWPVVINLRGESRENWPQVEALFPELPHGAFEAAWRFWQLHPDTIRRHFD